MLRLVALLPALAVLVLAGPAPPAPAGGVTVALVTAETLNELVVVALPSGQIVKRIPMPRDPQNVEIGSGVAVVVSPAAGAVTLLDLRRLRPARILRGFGSPHIATFSPDGSLLYVTDDARGQLDTIRLSCRCIVRRTFVGVGAHHISLDPYGRRAWIALGERAHAIAVVDTSSPARPRLIGDIDPHGLAHDLAFSPAGNSVWVSYDDRSQIAILSARTGRPLRYLAAGAPPQHVAFDRFSAARHAYVTSGYGAALRIFSLRGDRLIRRVGVPYGSFNLGLSGSLVATSSLYRGTLTELNDNGRMLLSKRVAPAARDVAIAVLP